MNNKTRNLLKQKKTVTRILPTFSLSLFLLVMSACGGGSSKAGAPAGVKYLFTDAMSVVTGDDVDLTVDFTYSTDTVVHDNHNVTIVVRLPSGLQLQPGTARIDEIGGIDSVTPVSEVCQNGDTYLRFDLGQNVLANADEPGGGADGRLIMAVLGTKAVGTVSIDASGGYDFETVTGSCAQTIIPQETTALTVL